MDGYPETLFYRLLSTVVVCFAAMTVPIQMANAENLLLEEEIEDRFVEGDLETKLDLIWQIPKIQRKFPYRAGKLIGLGIDDADEIVRQNVVLALEIMKKKEYLPRIEQALEDEKESVRWFARYAASAITGENPTTSTWQTEGKGLLKCKYRDMMIGYFGPVTPHNKFGWRFKDEFKRLGYAYSFASSRNMLWMFPDKPSWRGGRVRVPPSFWEAMRKYEDNELEFYVVFEFKPKGGEYGKQEKLGYKEIPPGWHAHFYEERLDQEIRKSWDRSAPPGWTLLDEFKLHVRDFMEADKQHGSLVDGWLFFSEPCRPNFFGNNYENVASLIQAGMEIAKEISPEAYLGLHGILRPRLERIRHLYAYGSTDIYAAAFRRNLNSMPESKHLRDEVDYGGGWLETFNAFYTQAKKWGIKDPRDGKTKVVDMEQFLHIIGEHRGTTREAMTFVADTPFQREKHADYWTRSILLALSTDFVCKLGSIYYKNPFWAWGSPNGIGIQLDVREMKQHRQRDIATEFELGKIPSKPKNTKNRSQVMLWTLYEIFQKGGRDGLYEAMDGYLASRRPDLKKRSYFAAMIMNHLLGRVTFISSLALEEPNFGFRFKDDETERMITALWRADEEEGEVTIKTDDPLLKVIQRESNHGIREYWLTPVEGRLTLKIGSNPIYVVGEIRDDEWVRVSHLNRSKDIVVGERGVIEIIYQSDRNLSGGSLEIEIPTGWIEPQARSSGIQGYVTVEPGPGVVVGKIRTNDLNIEIPIERMGNGHTLRVIYGDARKTSYLYDMGEDQFGPISLDHLKMQGNMIYYETAGDGFDHEGLPRSKNKFWSQWPSSGGCGIPDNDPHSIYRDMAVSATYDSWQFTVDANRAYSYQVKVFLNGDGKIDDDLSSQKVMIGNQTFDSMADRIVHHVKPDREGRIELELTPDGDDNSMDQYFTGDPREQIIYGHRRRIPDNSKICYLYGLEIIPEHLGGGPTANAIEGTNRFVFRTKSGDGMTSLMNADMTVNHKTSF